MGRKKVNICPVTGQEIRDRTYNKKAIYSKEGIKIHRKEYLREYKKVRNTIGKLVGVGVIEGEKYADRNTDKVGQRLV